MRAAVRRGGRRRQPRRRRAATPSVIIGVDVGGTTTAVGLVTRDGDVIADTSAPTRASSRDPLETIVALIGKLTARAGRSVRASAVGIGVPGPVDTGRGIVGEPVTHIPALEGRVPCARAPAPAWPSVAHDNQPPRL